MATVRGVGALRRALSRLGAGIDRKVGATLDDISTELLGRSQAIAPERTRRLIKSGRITRSDRAGRLERSISYNTSYAVKVHEDLLFPGPLTARKAATQDGAAGRKYLERPFLNMRRGMILALGAVPEDAARRIR